MKINTNLYGLIYKNHRGNFTKKPYQGFLWTSKEEARHQGNFFSASTKKNMQLVKIALETVE